MKDNPYWSLLFFPQIYLGQQPHGLIVLVLLLNSMVLLLNLMGFFLQNIQFFPAEPKSGFVLYSIKKD